ncbi:MAG: hypothetical protein AAF666_05480 [Pseudomonadota bacterium]
MSHGPGIRWLKFAGIVLAVIGVLFSWATVGPISAANVLFLDLALMPFDGAQDYAKPETRLLSAIAGGVTAGLGAAVYLLADTIMPLHPQAGRRIILNMMICWFVVDSIGSVIAGAWFNVVFNCIIFLGVTWPLLRHRQPATV